MIGAWMYMGAHHLAGSRVVWDNPGGQGPMKKDAYSIVDRRFFLKMVFTASINLLCGCANRYTMESLRIITRAEWGAREPNLETSVEGKYDAVENPEGLYVYQEPLPQVLNTIVVHHTARPLTDGPPEIQRLHMDQKGYADIGYHFIIDENGQIYEGRSINVRGAHTGGHNTGTVGAAFMGNFEEMTPTDAQIESFKNLARGLKNDFKITHLAGHRDFQPGVTVCPGENLEILLPGIADELRLKFGTDGYSGPVTA